MCPSLWKRLRLGWLIPAVLVGLGGTKPALAHKIDVFATVEGETIQGEAYYHGGDPARAAKVTVMGPDENVLGETTTDDEGRFTFPVRLRVNHTLIVDAGEGHGGEYTVPAGEFAGEAARGTPRDDDLQVRIDALEKQVAALRKDLDRFSNELRLQDILGGLGYILGIMGLVFYFLGVRRKEETQA